MGWDYFNTGFKTKEDAINAVVSTFNFTNPVFSQKSTVVSNSVVGNELWILREYENTEKKIVTIDVCVMKWKTITNGFFIAYKSFNICEQPYYFNCPEKYVKKITDNCKGVSEWISDYYYVKERKEKTKSIGIVFNTTFNWRGQVWTLVDNHDKMNFLVTDSNGKKWKMRKNQYREIIMKDYFKENS